MIQYKNISFSAKTFYGIRFEPQEIKEVPGYINDPGMIRIFKAPKKAIETPKFSEFTDTTSEPRIETRGRKKKSSEPEKGLVAEITETQITSEEETSNGN